IPSLPWYDLLRVTRSAGESASWRDRVATELAAVLTLARDLCCPVMHNAFEAALISAVWGAEWLPVSGAYFFEEVLKRANSPRDIIVQALALREEPAAAEWRRRVGQLLSSPNQIPVSAGGAESTGRW